MTILQASNSAEGINDAQSKQQDRRDYMVFLAVAFLNAFVDLGHKITIQNIIFKQFDGDQQVILSAIINACILLPFILLMTPAGFISDRFAKQRVIAWTSASAVLILLAINLCYWQGLFWPAFALTIVLAAQSAIYSPAKYGYLLERFGATQLVRANGLVQTVTIIAILLATLLCSALFEFFYQKSDASLNASLQSQWVLGLILLGLAVLQLVLSWRIRLISGVGKALRSWQLSNYLSGRYFYQNLSRLKARPNLAIIIVALCIFWSVSQVLLASFPAYAKATLGEDNTLIVQGILACTGIGIMLGSVLAARYSQGSIDVSLILIGALIIILGLLLIPVATSIAGYIVIFLLIGLGGGLFIVPLNSLLQYFADASVLGSVLAVNNWFQNIAMLLALIVTIIMAYYSYSGAPIFYVLAAFTLLVTGLTVYKMPVILQRLWLRLRLGLTKVELEGFDVLPAHGASIILSDQSDMQLFKTVRSILLRPVHAVVVGQSSLGAQQRIEIKACLARGEQIYLAGIPLQDLPVELRSCVLIRLEVTIKHKSRTAFGIKAKQLTTLIFSAVEPT